MLGLTQGLKCVCGLDQSWVKQCPFCAQSTVCGGMRRGYACLCREGSQGASPEMKREQAEGAHPLLPSAVRPGVMFTSAA